MHAYYYAMLPASSPRANLFIEVSAYNTKTTTNKYFSVDTLTNYHVTLHIGTQNYFNLVKKLLSLLERKRLSK